MALFLLYLCLGSFVGIIAGLLGIGGGLVIVPLLSFTFAIQGVPAESILHLALGTSLASIIFTSISSLRAHHSHQAVLWPVVVKITPGIIAGTYFGSWIAAHLSTGFLKVFFGFFLLYAATQMLLGYKPKPSRELPKSPMMIFAGGIIGIFSSLVGIGGGTLSVPFLVFHNTVIQKAIGTSSAIGLPIALAGTAGYIVHGWGVAGLPQGSFGYVYLTPLVGIVLASVCTAPIGARLTHRLPVARLKKIFAVLLYLVSIKMLLGSF